MSAARIAALNLRLQSIRRELHAALTERKRLLGAAELLIKLAAEQESATKAQAINDRATQQMAKADVYGRSIRALCAQENDVERELNNVEFLVRISSEQMAAVDETMGESA